MKLNQKFSAMEVGEARGSDRQKQIQIAPVAEEAEAEQTKEPEAPVEVPQAESSEVPVQTQLEQLLASLKEWERHRWVKRRFEDVYGVGVKATDEESLAAARAMQTTLQRIERGRDVESV